MCHTYYLGTYFKGKNVWQELPFACLLHFTGVSFFCKFGVSLFYCSFSLISTRQHSLFAADKEEGRKWLL